MRLTNDIFNLCVKTRNVQQVLSSYADINFRFFYRFIIKIVGEVYTIDKKLIFYTRLYFIIEYDNRYLVSLAFKRRNNHHR